MKRISVFVASLFAFNATAFATITVNVTASTQVTNIPADFGAPHFALDKPFYFGQLPDFAISAQPTMSALTIDPGFTIPGLSITNHVAPNNGLTWYYWCDGLNFQYDTNSVANATVVFTGTIRADAPGGGVQCTCSGSACSTTKTMPAKFVIMPAH